MTLTSSVTGEPLNKNMTHNDDLTLLNILFCTGKRLCQSSLDAFQYLVHDN